MCTQNVVIHGKINNQVIWREIRRNRIAKLNQVSIRLTTLFRLYMLPNNCLCKNGLFILFELNILDSRFSTGFSRFFKILSPPLRSWLLKNNLSLIFEKIRFDSPNPIICFVLYMKKKGKTIHIHNHMWLYSTIWMFFHLLYPHFSLNANLNIQTEWFEEIIWKRWFVEQTLFILGLPYFIKPQVNTDSCWLCICSRRHVNEMLTKNHSTNGRWWKNKLWIIPSYQNNQCYLDVYVSSTQMFIHDWHDGFVCCHISISNSNTHQKIK